MAVRRSQLPRSEFVAVCGGTQAVLQKSREAADLRGRRRLFDQRRQRPAEIERSGERRTSRLRNWSHRPVGRQRFEPGQIAQISPLAQRDVERGGRFARHFTGLSDLEMRRTQHRDDCASREIGLDQLEGEVERRCRRLRGKRRGVVRLKRRPVPGRDASGAR